MIACGPVKQEIVVIDCSPISTTISGRGFMVLCPLIFPLELLSFENVAVHKPNLTMVNFFS